MFRPKLPDTPHVPSITTHIPQDHAPAPSAGRPVTPYIGVGVGAVAAVAIAAVVLRSLVNGANRR
ncbi:SpdD protein [Streptomyces phyllanthi]|uniref:SpdD protein n=1 Tax=Streptomyces phyllanthi TaxID=1803180 RepID=A0A5N8W0W4_9ACTN|nr:SpdD protein [Streptomyces phyllanthi]MPY40879.1 SpdD protein [Streptomyces phyllanthi]